mmetsp:Transcript_35175/g.99181  ORF Transcript_35175/g.99181 Transcript_35175/m.99181 type:complete len:271 (-) Transcript_35175:576-1388(-)
MVNFGDTLFRNLSSGAKVDKYLVEVKHVNLPLHGFRCVAPHAVLEKVQLHIRLQSELVLEYVKKDTPPHAGNPVLPEPDLSCLRYFDLPFRRFPQPRNLRNHCPVLGVLLAVRRRRGRSAIHRRLALAVPVPPARAGYHLDLVRLRAARQAHHLVRYLAVAHTKLRWYGAKLQDEVFMAVRGFNEFHFQLQFSHRCRRRKLATLQHTGFRIQLRLSDGEARITLSKLTVKFVGHTRINSLEAYSETEVLVSRGNYLDHASLSLLADPFLL